VAPDLKPPVEVVHGAGGQRQPPTLTSASTSVFTTRSSASTPRSVRTAARRGCGDSWISTTKQGQSGLELEAQEAAIAVFYTQLGRNVAGAHRNFCHLAPDGRPERAVSLGVMRPVSQVA
jgi:hypothetical protein